MRLINRIKAMNKVYNNSNRYKINHKTTLNISHLIDPNHPINPSKNHTHNKIYKALDKYSK